MGSFVPSTLLVYPTPGEEGLDLVNTKLHPQTEGFPGFSLIFPSPTGPIRPCVSIMPRGWANCGRPRLPSVAMITHCSSVTIVCVFFCAPPRVLGVAGFDSALSVCLSRSPGSCGLCAFGYSRFLSAPATAL